MQEVLVCVCGGGRGLEGVRGGGRGYSSTHSSPDKSLWG